MNAKNTNSGPTAAARRTGPPVAAGHWWKAWVLLAGAGFTLFGWAVSPREEPPAVGGITSPVAPARADRPQAVPVRGSRAVPGMPQKPMFRAPITRTRRS